MTASTKTMDGFGGAGTPHRPGALVLLYAEGQAKLPPAIAIDEALVIGREPPVTGPRTLILEEQGVSRAHARIERLAAPANGFRIVDLDSKNGVIVNGTFVREAELEHDDVIRIGDALFKFVAEPAAPWLPYRIDGSVDNALLLHPPILDAEVIGGHQLQSILHELGRVANADLNVLVFGETGTGKGVVTRAFDRLQKSKARGAALMMLDDVGDMSLDEQIALRRSLEKDDAPRMVCTAHPNLEALVGEGKFRADLFARLNGYAIDLPPLRERKEDLFALVRHFAKTNGRPDLGVSFGFMVTLCHHHWPYNVRELENAVKRAITTSSSGPVLVEKDLPSSVRDAMRTYGEKNVKPTAATTATPTEVDLRSALAEARGNVSEVARRFGKDRTQIHRWLRHYGIALDEFRSS